MDILNFNLAFMVIYIVFRIFIFLVVHTVILIVLKVFFLIIVLTVIFITALGLYFRGLPVLLEPVWDYAIFCS